MLLLGAFVLATPACDLRPHGDHLDPENVDCAWDGDPSLDADLQEDAPAIELGTQSDADGFVAWSAGSVAELVVGGQGLEMITPTVRVIDGAAIDERCLHVSIQLREEGAPEEDGPVAIGENAYAFAADELDLYAGPIWVPFEVLDVAGTYDLIAVVTGDDWQSTTRFSVVVDST